MNAVECGSPIFNEATCTACGRCADICPTLSIRMKDGKPVVDRNETWHC